MTDKKRDAAVDKPESAPPSTSGPSKRPYRTPRVESYPLFERMALNCDPGMKNSGEDDFS